MSQLIEMRDVMLNILSAEQTHRNTNADWAEREFAVMLAAVNAEREKRSLPEVPRRELRDRERQALGHVDYSHKFALYCAELALGLPDRGP